MVAQPQGRYITPEQYLEQERKAATKSEYDDGALRAMAGGSLEHAAITFNLGAACAPHLRRSGCRAFSLDLRVRLETGNKYYYPDLAIVCGEPVYETFQGMRSLINPTIIAEVLSVSTERQDRGEKWLAYQSISELSIYLLVHQDRPTIEMYVRKQNNWEYRVVDGLASRLELPALGCQLALDDIYANVEFQKAEEVQE